MNTDVIVVGAGPAGAATAILLAEQGFKVLALDRAKLPRPKMCGEYLSPEAARVLDRLGVLKTLDAADAVPLLGMRITASTGPPWRSNTSRSWRMQGTRDTMMSSPRKTPNGSLPTSGRAHRIAWPRPSGSFWRTYDTEASSEMVLIWVSSSTFPRSCR